MYNGKNLNDEKTIKEWINKLSTFDSSLDYNKIDFEELKVGIFDEFGSSYIMKENGVVKLFLINDGNINEYISYSIDNNSFNINKELYNNEDSGALNSIERIFDNSITVSQTNNSFSYNNFGFVFIAPSLYNIALQESNKNPNNDIDLKKIWENIDYKKYTELGDLVCDTSVSINTIQETNATNNVNKYVGKYIGSGEGLASYSYIDLWDNGEAYLNINNCRGWSLYKGKYKINKNEYSDEDVIVINSFFIIDGEILNMPEKMTFHAKENKLFTLIGYVDTNRFDCAVDTDFIKR
ncbi:MAG: hypothetical protein ACI31M_04890 [Bacilli bacterium]